MALRVAKCVENNGPARAESSPLSQPLRLHARGRSPAALVELQKTFAESDAVVVVTPEYNHTFSPVISNTLNYFYHPEFCYKVAGIVTYSISMNGGSRAGVTLRPYLSELGFVSIPEEWSFPLVRGLLNEDGTVSSSAGEDAEAIEINAENFASELIWFATHLKRERDDGVPT
ncbi:unnamed protein product [Aphanomyces euteiches]